MIEHIRYTQNDLDAPHKFLGKVADKLNELIAVVQKENPVTVVHMVPLDLVISTLNDLRAPADQIKKVEGILRQGARSVEIPKN